jgi:large subunit ribosomal protein L21
MFAVIKTGGKQYVVKEGDVLQVEKLGLEAGRRILLDRVLLIEDGDKTLIGTPVLENAVVRAEIVKNLKGDKVLVFKKKRRKQFRRTRGHRQPLTEIRIERIIADKSTVPAEELKLDVKPVEKAIPAAKLAEKPAEKPSAVPVEKAAKAPEKKATKKEIKAKEKAAKVERPKAKSAVKVKAAEKPKTKAPKKSK